MKKHSFNNQFPSGRLTMRIVILFLICVLPFITISLFITNYAKNIMMENVFSSYEYKNKMIQEHLSENLNNILYQSASIITDSNALRYSSLKDDPSLSEFDVALLESQILDQAKSLLLTTRNVQNVWVCFPRLSTIFTTESNSASTLEMDELFQMFHAFDSRYRSAPLVFLNGKTYVVSWSNDYLSADDGSLPSIFTCVELSSTSLTSFLKRLLENEDGFLAIHDQQNRFFLSTDSQYTSSVQLEALSSDEYLSFSSLIPRYPLSLDYYVKTESITGIVNLVYKILAISLVCLSLVAAFFLTQLKKTLYQPLEILNSVFLSISNKDFKLPSEVKTEHVFAEYYAILDDLLVEIKNSIQEIVDYRFALKEAQLKQLQSNINPHFLYNSLFSISCLCRSGKNEQAADMVEKLSNLFRFMTKEENEYTFLKTELEYTKIYLDIQQMRFSARVKATVDPLP